MHQDTIFRRKYCDRHEIFSDGGGGGGISTFSKIDFPIRQNPNRKWSGGGGEVVKCKIISVYNSLYWIKMLCSNSA